MKFGKKVLCRSRRKYLQKTMNRLNNMDIISRVKCYISSVDGMIYRDLYARRMIEREITRYNHDSECTKDGSRAVLLIINNIPVDIVFTSKGDLKHIILVVKHDGKHVLYNSPYEVIVRQIAYPIVVNDLNDILNRGVLKYGDL